MLYKLKHRNIIELIEIIYNTENENMYVVLEFMNSGALDTLLESTENKFLPIPQAHKLFRQLIEGLNYIHAQGITHRDIKPANLLISNDGVLKLSDFGLSHYLDPTMDKSAFKETTTRRSIITGKINATPAFQPPEVTKGETKNGNMPGDIWAVGITLYQMITGNLPFDITGNVVTLYEQISQANFPIPENIDNNLASLLRGLLDPNPKTRLTTEQILQHSWVTTSLEAQCQLRTIPTELDEKELKALIEQHHIKREIANEDKRHFKCLVL